jgi:acylphosphatase
MPFEERRVVRIVVEGRVQGVGFRAFVAREAARRGLSGWVRNRRDGSVETVAVGPSGVIEEFAALTRRGPWASRVDVFRLEEADEAALLESGGAGGFTVAPDA